MKPTALLLVGIRPLILRYVGPALDVIESRFEVVRSRIRGDVQPAFKIIDSRFQYRGPSFHGGADPGFQIVYPLFGGQAGRSLRYIRFNLLQSRFDRRRRPVFLRHADSALEVIETLFQRAGGSLVSRRGGALVSRRGGALVGRRGGALVSRRGGALFGHRGRALVGPRGWPLFDIRKARFGRQTC